MDNCIRLLPNVCRRREELHCGPQRLGTILAELLAQYQVRGPEMRAAVVETNVAAA